MPSGKEIAGWKEQTAPNTAAKVFYSYKITCNGVPVGTFQNFAPSSTRTVERFRGIVNNGGEVLDMVPGVADTSVTVNDFALYRRGLLQALGYDSDIADLNKHRVEFVITETCNHPDGTVESYIYSGCWVSNFSRTITTGTTRIAETATIQVQNVR